MTKSQGPTKPQNPKAQLGFKDLGFDWSLDIGNWSLQLIRAGFDLVPRDDRLFDVFPHLTRHHGYELWEKWTKDEIEFVVIKFQDSKTKPQNMKFSRPQVEEALLHSTVFT